MVTGLGLMALSLMRGGIVFAIGLIGLVAWRFAR
jgi:hypothetical protein